jgi:hypothetical protein
MTSSALAASRTVRGDRPVRGGASAKVAEVGTDRHTAAARLQGDDPAARDLVERQRADRRGEIRRLAHHLHTSRRLRAGVGEKRATELLMVFTSYETFRELRLSGLSEAQLTKTLQESARMLLLG